MLHDIPDGRKPFFREIRKLIIERLPQTDVLLDIAGSLTRTEQKVISHMFLGLSDKEIATLTGTATAKVHSVANHIYKKLHVHNRREAVSAYVGFNHVAASRVVTRHDLFIHNGVHNFYTIAEIASQKQ